MSKEIPKGEKLWRISSLTASVDDETKILILPLPESKRNVKVIETKYEAKSYNDLVNTIDSIQESLTVSKTDQTSPKRYEDKTEDEMMEEMARKRKKQFGSLVRFRYYQFGALMGAMFFYLFVYRRFLYPTPVMHSASYSQAVAYIKANKTVKNKIGSKFQVMNCNGKMYPYKKDVKFDIVLFGTNANGKVKVTSFFDKPSQTWHMKNVALVTRNEVVTLI